MDLFDTEYKLNDHKLVWCYRCEIWSVIFDCCDNSSCNGGGCKKCRHETLKDYKLSPLDYMDIEEINALKKYNAFKRLIPICINAGFKQINIPYLCENGLISLNEEELLKI